LVVDGRDEEVFNFTTYFFVDRQWETAQRREKAAGPTHM
jgi:hypothetical protein